MSPVCVPPLTRMLREGSGMYGVVDDASSCMCVDVPARGPVIESALARSVAQETPSGGAGASAARLNSSGERRILSSGPVRAPVRCRIAARRARQSAHKAIRTAIDAVFPPGASTRNPVRFDRLGYFLVTHGTVEQWHRSTRSNHPEARAQ